MATQSTTLHIRRLHTAEDNIAEELNNLMGFLTDAPRPTLNKERLERIVGSDQTALFVAERGGEIVGSLTLVHYLTPVVDKFWIEDVVCAPRVRGKGIGRALVRHAIEFAHQINPNATIALTSNPQRVAARGLYRSEGFEIYETDVFTYNKQ